MKSKPIIIILVVFLFSISTEWNVNADQKKELYWYEVTIMQGEKSYEFYGTSTLDSESFVAKISKPQFIRLDNLVFRRQSGGKTTYSDWKEWDPLKKSYIYLNSKFVIAVHPLKHNPKTNK